MKLTIHKRFQTKLILIGQYEKRANIVLATENITTENNVPLHPISIFKNNYCVFFSPLAKLLCLFVLFLLLLLARND